MMQWMASLLLFVHEDLCDRLAVLARALGGVCIALTVFRYDNSTCGGVLAFLASSSRREGVGIYLLDRNRVVWSVLGSLFPARRKHPCAREGVLYFSRPGELGGHT